MIYQNSENVWCRNCFICGTEIIHNGVHGESNARFSDKLKRKCKKCSNIQRSKSLKGKPITEEHKNHISEAQRSDRAFWYGKTRSTDTKRKMSNARIGIKLSKETKQKLSEQKIGKNNHRYGKKATEEHREKMRIAALNRIKKQGIMVAFNPIACKFIEEFGKKNNYKFQHALNGGEVCLSGFPVDGFDKDKNIVFEYDESYHYYNKRKEKDKYKQQCIIKKINPKLFIRYDEKNNRLYDALTNLDLSQ